MKVYGVPLVRPGTVQLVAGALTVHPALEGWLVTVYDRMGEPPVEPGAQLTVTWPLPAVVPVMVGAAGATAT